MLSSYHDFLKKQIRFADDFVTSLLGAPSNLLIRSRLRLKHTVLNTFSLLFYVSYHALFRYCHKVVSLEEDLFKVDILS